LLEEANVVNQSAGILLYRFNNGKLELLLVHPGGPFWINKDEGVWSIPKGLFDEKEDPKDAAKREFREETGYDVDGEFIELGSLKQPSGKIIYIWALKKNLNVINITSNTFDLEWPKGSGQKQKFPEVDKADWFEIEEGKKKILKGQIDFIDRLIKKLHYFEKVEV
jgi:predicted NUDIX family NTP pyrophosphohydrolase